MPFALSDLKHGDATLWQWLEEATGKDASTLAVMAGIDPTSIENDSPNAEDRNKIYYLYMLVHEAQHRLGAAKLATWLETPLTCDFSAEEESWRIRYLKEDHYYQHYLKVSHEDVVEDFGCSLADNPYTLMAKRLDGRTPRQLLEEGEWEVVWQAVVETPCLYPRLSGHFHGRWSIDGWQVPYSGDNSWRPKNSYNWLIGDDTWELDEQYKKIDAELKRLFPYPDALLDRQEDSGWSQDELRDQIEQLAGYPIELLIGPETDASRPTDDGHDGDNFLVARYTWLRAFWQRDFKTALPLLDEVISCRPEPAEWLDGQREVRKLTLRQAIQEERWVALWQLLDDLPWRILPRVTLHKDEWVYEDECFLSDYPLSATQERYYNASEEVQDEILDEYPVLRRLLYVEPIDLSLFGMDPDFLQLAGIRLHEGGGGLSLSVNTVVEVDLSDFDSPRPIVTNPMPAEPPANVIAVEIREPSDQNS